MAGFIDDSVALHRREVGRLRVYPPTRLPVLIRDFGVKQPILSIPPLSPTRRKEIVASVVGQGVTVQSLPGIADLVAGRHLVSQVTEIEIDDLPGRSSVPADLGPIREMIGDRTVMVTSAGGSIGPEFCRKIAQWRPQRVVLFEANEFALYEIEKELRTATEASTVPVLGSVTDEQCVARAVSQHSVDVVFHAAAHKHAPRVKANAIEGIRNDVFGTVTVVSAAYRPGDKDFVLMSTDKAVGPTNVIGAAKRWAELIVAQNAGILELDQAISALREAIQHENEARAGYVI